MNPKIYLSHTSMLTPLGKGVQENIDNIINEFSGVALVNDATLCSHELPLSQIQNDSLFNEKNLTRFDNLIDRVLEDLIENCTLNFSSADVGIILSTTKGNIELIQSNPIDERLLLTYSANLIKQKLDNPNAPIVVSNACISGVSAFIVAKRLISQGDYKHILIVGCDVLSKFVINGFASFKALSDSRCKPFDSARDGINLGEASVACVLSSEIESEIEILDGFISNDANHISGPSKTGEELHFCIEQCLNQSNIESEEVDFVFAHGTATNYNDEMESKAIALSGIHVCPVFSLKAYYGHTLGASGVLEIALSAAFLQQGIIPKSLGFEEKGVSGDIQVSKEFVKRDLHIALKTASGFGGCNAAILLRKV